MRALTPRTIGAAILAAVVLALLPAAGPADASSAVRRCETTAHGKRCVMLHMPAAGSAMRREAARFKRAPYIPLDSQSVATYLGYGKRSVENGRTVWVVRSHRAGHYYHTYKVTPRPSTCSPARWDIAGARTSESYVYAQFLPVCKGHRWTLATDRILPEDAYGWNCWIDGDGGCGDVGEQTADGCLSYSGDRYTMCRDGRVYLLDGFRHVAELRRVAIVR